MKNLTINELLLLGEAMEYYRQHKANEQFMEFHRFVLSEERDYEEIKNLVGEFSSALKTNLEILELLQEKIEQEKERIKNNE